MSQPESARSAIAPKCEDCGFTQVRGELDRSGQSWWCPVCAKAGIRLAENKRLRERIKDLESALSQSGEHERLALALQEIRDTGIDGFDGHDFAQWYAWARDKAESALGDRRYNEEQQAMVENATLAKVAPSSIAPKVAEALALLRRSIPSHGTYSEDMINAFAVVESALSAIGEREHELLRRIDLAWGECCGGRITKAEQVAINEQAITEYNITRRADRTADQRDISSRSPADG